MFPKRKLGAAIKKRGREGRVGRNNHALSLHLADKEANTQRGKWLSPKASGLLRRGGSLAFGFSLDGEKRKELHVVSVCLPVGDSQHQSLPRREGEGFRGMLVAKAASPMYFLGFA